MQGANTLTVGVGVWLNSRHVVYELSNVVTGYREPAHYGILFGFVLRRGLNRTEFSEVNKRFVLVMFCTSVRHT